MATFVVQYVTLSGNVRSIDLKPDPPDTIPLIPGLSSVEIEDVIVPAYCLGSTCDGVTVTFLGTSPIPIPIETTVDDHETRITTLEGV